MNPERGREYLESNGINLFHVFSTQALADLLTPAIPDLDLDQYPSAVLIANAGEKLWHALQEFGMHGDNPVDHFSHHIAMTYAREYLNTDMEILYPSDYPISLRSIGARTGWSHPSPMGITIHPKFGTWYAYRALFLINTQLPASSTLPTDHPCESCVDKPCISVCHVGAVREVGAFGLDECAQFRIRDTSPCSFSCTSRIRCPVGSEYRYVPQQMKYHYRRSRESMARYYRSQGTGVERS